MLCSELHIGYSKKKAGSFNYTPITRMSRERMCFIPKITMQVQSLTREKRKEFARMKDNTIQKIEILAASRINLFSARLEDYHKSYQKYLQSCINALKEVTHNRSGIKARQMHYKLDLHPRILQRQINPNAHSNPNPNLYPNPYPSTPPYVSC